MIGLIAGTLVFIYFVYLLVKQYIYESSDIPGPPAWPIIYHTHYFIGNKDVIGMRKKWAEEFKNEGLYKFKAIQFPGHIVSLLKPEYVKAVLSRPSSWQRLGLLKDFFPLMKNGLLVVTGEDHSFQKKLLSKAFSSMQMKSYMPVFNRHVAVLIDILRKEVDGASDGKKIDVRKYCNNLTFDVISDAAFGYSSSAQSSENKLTSSFKNTVEGIFMNIYVRILMRFFPFILSLPFGPGKIMKDCTKTSAEILDKVLTDRKEKMERNELTDEEKNDMLSIMLNEREENTNGRLTDQVIKDNIFTFFLAGHETSATAIPITLLFLSKYPELQEKARSEIKEMLGEKSELSVEDTNSVPYTVAFIKETLRVLPAVPVTGRVSVCDMQFGKYNIPKGTFLSFEHFTLNKDEDDFDNSFEFMPERYLENSGMKTGTSFTFGYGSYSCIGKTFAMQEIKVAIIRLLQNFRLTVDSGDDVFMWGMGLTIKPIPNILIRMVPLKA